MKQVAVLILLILLVWNDRDLHAQFEVGFRLQALKMFGTDDEAFRPVFGASLGYQIHELYTVEVTAGVSPERIFQSQEPLKAIDPNTQPNFYYGQNLDARSNLFGIGFALKGLAVAADGKHKHLQLYGRLELGWQQYSVDFSGRSQLQYSGTNGKMYETTLPAFMNLSTVYIEPSAGVEWVIDNVRPYLQIGANLPTYRQEVPEGSNVGLNTSLRISAGFCVQFGQTKWS